MTDLSIGRSCEMSKEMTLLQLKQNEKCAKERIVVLTKVLDDIDAITKTASYEVCNLLYPAIGRVLHEKRMTERDLSETVKSIKREEKGK
jgi:hypothetical protein